MKISRQELIDERHRIYLELMAGMKDGTDMSTVEYVKKNERYHYLDEKIRKLGGSEG